MQNVQFDFAVEGEPGALINVSVAVDKLPFISEKLTYPNVKIEMTAFYENDEKFRDCDSYRFDQYMQQYYLYKTVDIRSILKKLVIHFKKITDNRDRSEFGFKENYTSKGIIKYDIPEDILDLVAEDYFRIVSTKSVQFDTRLSKKIQKSIIDRITTNLLEDEFKALVELRDLHKKALMEAINMELSEEEQADIWNQVTNQISEESRVCINVEGLRSDTVLDYNLAWIKEYRDGLMFE